MSIPPDIFFTPSIHPDILEGLWKPTAQGGMVKITCSLRESKKLHLLIATQTAAQRFFNELVGLITCGSVLHAFNTQTIFSQDGEFDRTKAKNVITEYYCKMATKDASLSHTNQIASDIFNRLLKKPSFEAALLPPLTPQQIALGDRLQQSTILIVKNILMFFANPAIRSLDPFQLREILEAAQESYPPHMDKRAETFCQHMMSPINLILDGMQGMPQAFEALARTSQDPEIRKKVVEGIAFPFLLNLLKELDEETPSIADQLMG